MNNALKIKIKDLLEKNSLSISEAERRAGLKTSAIRNIISGQSKNPSAHTLQKLSKVLGCSIYNLLDETPDSSLGYNEGETLKNSSLSSEIKNLKIFQEAINEILDLLILKDISTDVETISIISEQVYSYSIDNNLCNIDKIFSKWVVEQRFSD